jgi:hypothetical protein
MKIGEYSTVSASDLKHLDQFVKQLLSQGFQPFGSPYIIDRGTEFLICQAMTKESPGKSGMVPAGI